MTPDPSLQPPLRPYVLAIAAAVGCFVAANAAIYFLFFRPAPALSVAEAPAAAQAPAAQAPAPQAPALGAAPGGNLLAAPDRWLPVTGEWTLDGTTARQAQTNDYDLMLLYNQPAPQPQLTVRLRHEQGVGGGVVFNAPASGAKPGTHLVRYQDAQTLLWGYFDADGNFVGQGTAAIADPGTAVHTLAVAVGADTYAITLDGTQLAQAIPVVGRGEYAGLAAAQSSVVFESASIVGASAPPATSAAPDAAAPAALAATAPQLQPGAGDWVQENGAILQRSDQAADLFATYGATGDRYTLSVDVLLPTGASEDTGGGLLFAMPDPAGLAGAQMVRFNRNGQELFWGVFNDQGAFQGQGGAALTLDLSKPHNLKVVVNGNTYELWVDGQQVAAGRPLNRAAGNAGLITYRGPITFTNYSLSANAGS